VTALGEHARHVGRAVLREGGTAEEAVDAAVAVLDTALAAYTEGHSQGLDVPAAAAWLAEQSKHPRYVAAPDPGAAVLASEADVEMAARAALRSGLPGDSVFAADVAKVRALLLDHVKGDAGGRAP
jgi:hypothetical protein